MGKVLKKFMSKATNITISAVIITKNEEKMLQACIDSLSWVDEIVVIDTGSDDNTVKIAKKGKARVFEYLDGKTFSDWRNKGLHEAKGDWIFYVDADERVPKALQSEILKTISSSAIFTSYAIPRSNIIFGQEFRFGGFWPDYVKRLYKREALKRWIGELHEEPVVTGDMGHLKSHLMHDKHETIFEMVEKTNRWSAIEAKLMYDAHHPPMNIVRFTTAMLREFWYRMIKKQAFRDGKKGIIMAIYQVFSRFCSYAKLWELQIKKTNS